MIRKLSNIDNNNINIVTFESQSKYHSRNRISKPLVSWPYIKQISNYIYYHGHYEKTSGWFSVCNHIGNVKNYRNEWKSCLNCSPIKNIFLKYKILIFTKITFVLKVLVMLFPFLSIYLPYIVIVSSNKTSKNKIKYALYYTYHAKSKNTYFQRDTKTAMGHFATAMSPCVFITIRNFVLHLSFEW